MGVMQEAQSLQQAFAGAVMCLAVTGSTPTAFSLDANNDKNNDNERFPADDDQVSGHGDHV